MVFVYGRRLSDQLPHAARVGEPLLLSEIVDSRRRSSNAQYFSHERSRTALEARQAVAAEAATNGIFFCRRRRRRRRRLINNRIQRSILWNDEHVQMVVVVVAAAATTSWS